MMNVFFKVILMCMMGYLYFATQASASVFDDGQISCLLEPSDDIQLSSQVNGVARKIHVKRGDAVKRGQLLVSLKSQVERIQLDLAKARDELSSKKIERNKELMQKQLLSGHETDELLTEREIATLEVAYARANLSRRSIYSPVTGLVTEKNISVGEYVGNEPIMTIVVLNPLHAEVVLNSNYYGEIKQGQKVKVIVDEQGGHSLDGTVSTVDKVIHAASGTFGIQVEVENKNQKLPSGLKCRIQAAE